MLFESSWRTWHCASVWLCDFALHGWECTILPASPSWTWVKRLVDAKKNANNSSDSAPENFANFLKTAAKVGKYA